MTPPRRYLWRTARGSTYRAQGIPARQPDGRVVVTTDRETRIESVHLPADPLRYPAGWYLRVAGPHGDEWSVGPLVWGRNDPAPTTPPAITPPGCVEDFGTVVLADPDRYARHLESEWDDVAFLADWNAARDLDTVVWTPDDGHPARGRTYTGEEGTPKA